VMFILRSGSNPTRGVALSTHYPKLSRTEINREAPGASTQASQ
jgi:hypothetical protein